MFSLPVRTVHAATATAFPDAGPDELYELVNSDWLFRMPSLHLAEAQTAGGGRAHVYELTWPAPGMGGALGACHGLDVPLVFGNLDRGRPAMLIGEGPSPEAEALSALMRAAWTAFATHGDPGWPAYDHRATPHPALRHPVGGHRLPGRDLPADLAEPHLFRAAAARLVGAARGRPSRAPRPVREWPIPFGGGRGLPGTEARPARRAAPLAR